MSQNGAAMTSLSAAAILLDVVPVVQNLASDGRKACPVKADCLDVVPFAEFFHEGYRYFPRPGFCPHRTVYENESVHIAFSLDCHQPFDPAVEVYFPFSLKTCSNIMCANVSLSAILLPAVSLAANIEFNCHFPK